MDKYRKRMFMSTRKTIVEDGVYHVTQRAPGKEIIFVEENDYKKFLQLLKLTSREFSLEIFCFALMPNHVHILLKNKKENLSQAMKYLFQRYALWFNRKYERKGHVFCGAYRAALCMDDDYLITISLYIHLNPFKARLTKDVFDYRWSSLNCYLNVKHNSFIKINTIMDMIGYNGKGGLVYKELINEVKSLHYNSIFEDRYGGKNFSKKVLNFLTSGTKNNLLKKTKFFKGIYNNADKIAAILNIKRKSRFEDKKAFKYCVEQLLSRGYDYREITEKFKVNRTTIYRVMQQKC